MEKKARTTRVGFGDLFIAIMAIFLFSPKIRINFCTQQIPIGFIRAPEGPKSRNIFRIGSCKLVVYV
jgi:hypothetical protein